MYMHYCWVYYIAHHAAYSVCVCGSKVCSNLNTYVARYLKPQAALLLIMRTVLLCSTHKWCLIYLRKYGVRYAELYYQHCNLYAGLEVPAHLATVTYHALWYNEQARQ